MKQIDIVNNLTELELLEVADLFYGAGPYLLSLNLTNNSRYVKIVNDKMLDFDIKWKPRNKLYNTITKICPVCKNKFITKSGGTDATTTCGYSCSNTYFRKLRNKPEYYSNYRTICFAYHKKECIICGDLNIVEVHNLAENHKNDSPYNLITLCPTHHQYWHSKYK